MKRNFMSRLGWCQNVGVSGAAVMRPPSGTHVHTAVEALQVVAPTSSGTLHNNRLRSIEFQS